MVPMVQRVKKIAYDDNIQKTHFTTNMQTLGTIGTLDLFEKQEFNYKGSEG